jgi:hypothetical protein
MAIMREGGSSGGEDNQSRTGNLAKMPQIQIAVQSLTCKGHFGKRLIRIDGEHPAFALIPDSTQFVPVGKTTWRFRLR